MLGKLCKASKIFGLLATGTMAAGAFADFSGDFSRVSKNYCSYVVFLCSDCSECRNHFLKL
jgi:hypothetical protein